ncbi:MAG: peptidoglycan bridge formation glycyltransferase FemA/FemB family protein [bacterium]|nr:peptidoglycan bridge formation glycyltransferase FemA/FemB family protein [bacterium]
MQDLRQSTEYGKHMEAIGWKVEKINSTQAFIRPLLFIGSIIKIQRPQNLSFPDIDKLAKKYKAIFVKVEPCNHGNTEIFRNHGFKKNKSPMLCSKTIQIDLTKSEEQILKDMKKDTRYELKKIPKNKITLEETNDLFLFRKFWKEYASFKRWIPPISFLQSLKKSFGKNSIFLLAKQDEKILGGITLILNERTAYYYFAFSSKEGKKSGVPYFLVWEAIKLAKSSKCKAFDFEGIYDERFPNNSWQGFTHFKKGFGGKEVEFPQPIIKLYNPVLKLIAKYL